MGLNVTPGDHLMDAVDLLLLEQLEDGLPLVARPYADLAARIGTSERDVVTRIETLRAQGVIKRFGVVVRHHELGYRSNGMVVWDVPDDQVRETGLRLGNYPFVTLCYRRPRRLPDWPYNLFTMIHGRDRRQVLEHVTELVQTADLSDIPHHVLFSRRRFKQRGARYSPQRSGESSTQNLAGSP